MRVVCEAPINMIGAFYVSEKTLQSTCSSVVADSFQLRVKR